MSVRVAYLAHGATIHTVRRVNKLSELGCAVDLITLHPPDGRNGLDRAVRLHVLPFPPRFGYVLNAPAVRRLLRALNPDVLHAHYASGYGTLARLGGFHPTILSVWGSDVFDFPYQAAWKRMLVRKNLAFADYIDSSSEVMKRQTERLVRPRNLIAILPPGVDCEKFRAVRRHGDRAEVVVGTVKRLEEKYGIEYLIRGFAIARRRAPDARVRLLIVGEGPLRPELERLACELGVDEVIEFAGSMPHSAVPECLNRMDIFVAVSVLDSESFGVAVLEAAACELPVVVSDAGGLQEVVEDKVTGLVVPRQDAEATAEAILTLVHDRELRERMGAEGRKLVRARYEWGENARRMKQLYEEAVQEWHRQARAT